VKNLVMIPLMAALVACGGGDEALADEATCMAADVATANHLIAQHGDLQCRVWTVDGQIVDGAAYPQFLIGGEV
jgi:hypothetical protein